MYWHSCVAAVLKVLTVSPAITYNWLLFFRVPPGNRGSSQALGGVLGLGRLLWAGEVWENAQDWLRKGNVAPSCLSLGLPEHPSSSSSLCRFAVKQMPSVMAVDALEKVHHLRDGQIPWFWCNNPIIVQLAVLVERGWVLLWCCTATLSRGAPECSTERVLSWN